MQIKNIKPGEMFYTVNGQYVKLADGRSLHLDSQVAEHLSGFAYDKPVRDGWDEMKRGDVCYIVGVTGLFMKTGPESAVWLTTENKGHPCTITSEGAPCIKVEGEFRPFRAESGARLNAVNLDNGLAIYFPPDDRVDSDTVQYRDIGFCQCFEYDNQVWVKANNNALNLENGEYEFFGSDIEVIKLEGTLHVS